MATAPDIDFDALVHDAYDPETGEPRSMDALDNLWAAFLQLHDWNFLVKAPGENEPPRDPYPYVGYVDGKSWVFVFTDARRLREYAREHSFTHADGSALMITMPKDGALDWLVELGGNGVYGMRINDGEHGWFSPLEQLKPIRAHLRKLGKIQ